MKPISNKFTLVELLIVIAIISVLMTLLLPALNKAKGFAKRSTCSNTMKHFAMANEMYATDFDGWQWPDFVGPDTNRTFWPYLPELYNYLGINNTQVIWSSGEFYWPQEFICPEATLSLKTHKDGLYSIIHSMGINITRPKKFDGLGLSEWYQPWASSFRGFRFSDIKSPSEKLRCVDATDRNVVRTRSAANSFYFNYGEQHLGTTNSAQTAYRHNNGANIGFFDGHTEWRRYNDIQKSESLYLVDY